VHLSPFGYVGGGGGGGCGVGWRKETEEVPSLSGN